MPISFNQIEKILLAYWYTLKSQKWSHKKYQLNWNVIVVPEHKEFKRKTWKSIVIMICEQNNLDFKKFMKDNWLKM